jgi:hypothetical protein
VAAVFAVLIAEIITSTGKRRVPDAKSRRLSTNATER